MSEVKKTVNDEELKQVSGGGYLADANGNRISDYEDKSQYAVLEVQPVENDTGLHCPTEGCAGFLIYDMPQADVWKFHCPECGKIFLKSQYTMLWMGKINQ